MKRTIIKQSQLDKLYEKWRSDLVVAKQITEDINYLKTKINESHTLNEGVVDVLKDYVRKGVLTAVVAASLLGSNVVNAQQLAQAGVPAQRIEKAMQINQGGSQQGGGVPIEQIDAKLVKNMKRQGQDGALRSYQNMDKTEKQNLLLGIQKQISSIDDIDNKFPVILGYVEKVGEKNQFALSQKTEQKIVVDTAYVRATLPLTQGFAFNSAKLVNPQAMKKQILDSLNTFVKIDSIVIVASSSALRNTGEFEGLTWMEGSQQRADSVKQLLVGATYDVGGQGKNTRHTVTENLVKINVAGDNGDGTSGPPSPYELDPGMVQNYKDRGIDAKFWDSQGKGDAYTNKDDYKQHQKVEIIIFGQMVETSTKEIVNIKIATLREFRTGKVQVTKPKFTTLQLNKCPI
jgi:hypothetical protein